MVGESKKSNTASQEQKDIRPNVELNLGSFITKSSMILIYESSDHLAQIQEGPKEGNVVDELMLQFFRERYENVCYKNTYIKEITRLLSRTSTRIENTREGGITYEADCLVETEVIEIPEFMVLNCEVESCSRHNNKAEFMVKRGEMKMFIEDDNADVIVQGMIIPCVVYETEYHNGKEFIGAFGSIFKKMEIKEQYNIIGESQQNSQALDTIVTKVIAIYNEILNSTKHNNPQQLNKIVSLLSGQQPQKELCEFKPDSIKKLLEIKNGPICIDMTGFITGNISRELDVSVQCIDGEESDILYEIMLATERWMTLYYELTLIIENQKNREVIESII